MKEARTHKRYSFLARATITHINRLRSNITTTVGNISSTGISLKTYQNIDRDSDIVMELVFTCQSSQKVSSRLKGTVVRTDRLNGFYQIGIMFDEEIRKDNHPVLYDYFHKGPVKFIISDR